MSPPPPYVIGPLWALSELGLGLFKRARGNATARDRHSLGLIWLVNMVSVAAGVTLAYNCRAWAFPWRPQPQILGVILFGAGVVLRWYSIICLGRFFTVNVAIAADHRVIQSGPYRFIRHPSYAGGLLMTLGFSLSLGNLASLLVIFVPCAGVLLWRIHIEETALTQALGVEYKTYMQRTKRLVPFLY